MRGSQIIRDNAEKDPTYAPYCLACSTMTRMNIVEPFFWRCAQCGAEHDERTPSSALPDSETPTSSEDSLPPAAELIEAAETVCGPAVPRIAPPDQAGRRVTDEDVRLADNELGWAVSTIDGDEFRQDLRRVLEDFLSRRASSVVETAGARDISDDDAVNNLVGAARAFERNGNMPDFQHLTAAQEIVKQKLARAAVQQGDTAGARDAMREAADELEADYRERYGDGKGGIHIALRSKFERDMDLVRRLRAAVQQEGATDAEAKDDADLLNRVYHMRTVEGGHELPLTGRALLANLRLHEDLKRTATPAGRQSSPARCPKCGGDNLCNDAACGLTRGVCE